MSAPMGNNPQGNEPCVPGNRYLANVGESSTGVSPNQYLKRYQKTAKL